MSDIVFYLVIALGCLFFVISFLFLQARSDLLKKMLLKDIDESFTPKLDSAIQYLEKGYKLRCDIWPNNSFIRLVKKGSKIKYNGKFVKLDNNELLDELNCAYPFAGLPCDHHLNGNSSWFLHDKDGKLLKQL